KAIPLQLVSRIEEAGAAAVEYANGKPVLQYRGRLMPLVALDEGVRIGAARQPVVVFEDETRAIGLVVEEIVDVIESPLHQAFKPSGPDALGSLVVADRVTDIIDLAHYWRRAAFDAAPARTAPAAKRALIVDPSPFKRNLIAPLLAMAGYEVLTAESAEAAGALIARESFSVILSDTALPAREQLSAAAPVIGLYDDPLSVRQSDAEGFAQMACRFDRDALLATLDALSRQAA
ncbi:MAG TPA: chemotaxis protein CheW, partial [Terricaulis sp.]|nr:chemotaxis protein CheW [Terricaulis sp.]